MSGVMGKLIKEVFKNRLYHKGTGMPGAICTDSRSLENGQVFLALRGERFDGHGFLKTALEKGASGLIVSERAALDGLDLKDAWVYVVRDTTAAYQELAKAYLETKPHLIKIGITGTSGKTTTKEFVRALLSVKYKVYANRGNYNNQIGVPLSMLEVGEEEIAVFEMGAGEPGDIERLSDLVRNQWAMVTAVGAGHLEFFGTVEGVAREKSKIAGYAHEAYCPRGILHGKYFKDFNKVDARALFSDICLSASGYQFKLGVTELSLPFWGEYNLDNFALAVVVALKLGLSPQEIGEGIKAIQIPSLRQEYKCKEGRHFWLDCYNANPLSMGKALEGFAELPGAKIAVLADMLELGEDKGQLHREIGEELNTLSLSKVYFCGELMREAYDVYRGPKGFYENKIKLTAELQRESKTGDVILLKASRGMKLEEVYDMF